jgi:ubiquinone biosynthesis protein Coq4
MNWLKKLQTMPLVQTLLLLIYRPKLVLQMAQMMTLPTFQPFLALMAGDESLDVVELMSASLIETSTFDQAITYLKQDPDCAALIAERYMAPPHDLDALLQHPKDSLGYIYATQMKERGFRAEDLCQGISIDSEASYLEARLSQTHDIWHIVTGFGVNAVEEIGLQAFHLPQFPYPLAIALLSSSMMSTLLFSPKGLPMLLESIQKGWAMGQLAQPLFAQKWEEAWEKPLAQWQTELGIQPLRPLAVAQV